MVEKMGPGKIPWYTHRLMPRKRVTCELHDSYFRLMTIKHEIPKIEWAIELLYNSVETGSQWVGVDELETRYGRESPHSAESWSPVEHQENEKDTTLMAIRVGVNILQFCSVSNSLSHANLTIKWEVYFFLKKSSLVFIHCINMYSACICRCICMWAYNKNSGAWFPGLIQKSMSHQMW